MMKMDTTVSLSFIFSFISMLGVLVTIYGTFKRQNDSEGKKEIDIEKNFVKVNLKLDEFCRQIGILTKTTEKSADVINEIKDVLTKHTEQITNLKDKANDHERRIRELEVKIK